MQQRLRVGERRACRVLGQSRATQRRVLRVAEDEPRLVARIVELARAYGRYGYRRITALLRREGWRVNTKRVARIWRQQGLKVPRWQPKRRRSWLADGSCVRRRAERPNHVWSYDFVFDRTHDGRPIRMLVIVDEFTRECLAIDVAGGIRSGRVIEVLSKLISVRGAPVYLRSDNGPEFVSRAVLQWLHAAGIETAPIDPGKPWQNGMNESFNGKFRDECLGMQWFKNRIDAKVVIESWRRSYNEIRPHSSLNNLTPAEYATDISTRSPVHAIF